MNSPTSSIGAFELEGDGEITTRWNPGNETQVLGWQTPLGAALALSTAERVTGGALSQYGDWRAPQGEWYHHLADLAAFNDGLQAVNQTIGFGFWMSFFRWSRASKGGRVIVIEFATIDAPGCLHLMQNTGTAAVLQQARQALIELQLAAPGDFPE